MKRIRDFFGVRKKRTTPVWEVKKLAQEWLQEEISEGNYGKVYKGRYKGKPAITKLLCRENWSNTRTVARFRREAKFMMQVAHPNVVQIYDIGYTDAGEHFIVMEYFAGRSLENMRMAITDVMHIGKEVARGLEKIHACGIIHRDIKPSNILYCRDSRQVKIIDLGIAKEIEAKETLTQFGFTPGTLDYMAPEQCLGYGIDNRADIYSLGVTLYQLATGKLPIAATGTPVQIMAAHLSQKITWDEESSRLPGSFRTIVSRMLEKDPEARYQNAAEVIAALSQ